MQGYRVLVLDCDSQATATTLFGFNPHFNIAREQTLYPYLSIDPTQTSLLYAVMQAANALLVPPAATTADFCSTVQFLSMTDQVKQQLMAAGIEVSYDFVRLICSKFDSNDPSHAMIRPIMEQAFGPALLPVSIPASPEISHAALQMLTIY